MHGESETKREVVVNLIETTFIYRISIEKRERECGWHGSQTVGGFMIILKLHLFLLSTTYFDFISIILFFVLLTTTTTSSSH
jgi:hypothetical protein